MTRQFVFSSLASCTRHLVGGRSHLAFLHTGRNLQRIINSPDTSASVRRICTSSSLLKKRKMTDEEWERTFKEQKPPPHPADDPHGRTYRILKHDILSLFIPQKPLLEFSSHVDICIIGGGIVGSAIAYMIKERTPREALKVMVIEKDPTYSKSATVMSIGGLRKQFTLYENIQMAQYGAEFLRQVPKLLDCDGDSPPDIQYHPYGYLHLAGEEDAEVLQESWLKQKELGCHTEILTKERVKDRFPWINTDGVEVACLGTEGEGWFDAWALHFALKKKAWFHGTEYIQAEVEGFDFERTTTVVAGTDHEDLHIAPRSVLVRTKSGELKSIFYSHLVIAAGHESGAIADMARIGRGKGILSVPLPVEPRKRLVYCLQAPEGPGIDCPLVVNTDGTYFRREGYAGHYVAGHSPPLEKDPQDEHLEVDYAYFDNVVWPSLAHRVPGFKSLKLNSAWAGYYDYNRFDQSGIFGPHPYYPFIYFACGFSGHGIIQAPAVARATMEMILDGEFRTLDLTKFHFERFLLGKEIREDLVN